MVGNQVATVITSSHFFNCLSLSSFAVRVVSAIKLALLQEFVVITYFTSRKEANFSSKHLLNLHSVRWQSSTDSIAYSSSFESKHSYKETDELWGFDPYSTSKTMSEFVVNSYTNSFLKQLWKKICTLRAWNVIWWWDWVKYRLIPDIVRSVYEKNKLKIRNPHSIRPWQYVLEAIYWYLIVWKKMFEDDKYIWAYNFWPDIDDNIKVIDVVKNSVKILWKWNFEISKDFANFHEAWLLLLDNTKAKSLLWRTPKYKIKETLKRTFNWYKIYYNNQDIEKLSLKEINDFNF